ncbi:MAG: ribosome maturation factor RimM [Aquificota bacterium]|nr:ribosome maturation factor RimM [Aquificota bacterium]MDQ7083250.1 ribosome maturation factor RimM [Aquificota bacterium]
MGYVVIGRVLDTFGTKGELKVFPYAPEEVYENLKRVYLKRKGGDYFSFEVEWVRKHREFYLVKLKGYDDIGSAEQFRKATLFLPEEELPERGEDEFYAYEIVGMEVITDRGRVLGRVKRVEDYGVYDMLILEDEKTYIPFVGEIVLKVDREKNRIEVKEDLIVI